MKLTETVQSITDAVNTLVDRIEGLEADLCSAVEVAFSRGATEWTRLNYPETYQRLTEADPDMSHLEDRSYLKTDPNAPRDVIKLCGVSTRHPDYVFENDMVGRDYLIRHAGKLYWYNSSKEREVPYVDKDGVARVATVRTSTYFEAKVYDADAGKVVQRDTSLGRMYRKLVGGGRN